MNHFARFICNASSHSLICFGNVDICVLDFLKPWKTNICKPHPDRLSLSQTKPAKRVWRCWKKKKKTTNHKGSTERLSCWSKGRGGVVCVVCVCAWYQALCVENKVPAPFFQETSTPNRTYLRKDHAIFFWRGVRDWRVLTVLEENPSSVDSTHIRWSQTR